MAQRTGSLGLGGHLEDAGSAAGGTRRVISNSGRRDAPGREGSADRDTGGDAGEHGDDGVGGVWVGCSGGRRGFRGGHVCWMREHCGEDQTGHVLGAGERCVCEQGIATVVACKRRDEMCGEKGRADGWRAL